MTIASFPFQTFNWSSIPRTEHKGESGIAYWQTQKLNDIRVRLWNTHLVTRQITGVQKAMCFIVLKVKWKQNYRMGASCPYRRECAISLATIMNPIDHLPKRAANYLLLIRDSSQSSH